MEGLARQFTDALGVTETDENEQVEQTSNRGSQRSSKKASRSGTMKSQGSGSMSRQASKESNREEAEEEQQPEEQEEEEEQQEEQEEEQEEQAEEQDENEGEEEKGEEPEQADEAEAPVESTGPSTSASVKKSADGKWVINDGHLATNPDVAMATGGPKIMSLQGQPLGEDGLPIVSKSKKCPTTGKWLVPDTDAAMATNPDVALSGKTKVAAVTTLQGGVVNDDGTIDTVFKSKKDPNTGKWLVPNTNYTDVGDRQANVDALKKEEDDKYADPMTAKYSAEELQNGARPDDVNPICKEMYLESTTFEELFKMDKEAYQAQPKWKRDRARKDNGFF